MLTGSGLDYEWLDSPREFGVRNFVFSVRENKYKVEFIFVSGLSVSKELSNSDVLACARDLENCRSISVLPGLKCVRAFYLGGRNAKLWQQCC